MTPGDAGSLQVTPGDAGDARAGCVWLIAGLSGVAAANRASVRARFVLRTSGEPYPAWKPNMPTGVALETQRSLRRDLVLPLSRPAGLARGSNPHAPGAGRSVELRRVVR